MYRLIVPLILMLCAGGIVYSQSGTVYWLDNQLVSDCPSGDYNRTTRDCTGSDGIAYNTPAEAISPMIAGDTLCIREGTTYTQQFDFQVGNKSGQPGALITVGGCNGEKPTIRFVDSAIPGYGPIKARGNRGYFVFQDMVLDGGGSTSTSKSGWSIRDGNHHFTLRRLEIKNFINVSAVYVHLAPFTTIEDCLLHGTVSGTQASGTFHYGIYWYAGDNGVVRRNKIYNNTGGGMQIYPGPSNNVHVYKNDIYDNDTWPTVHVGGIEVNAPLVATPIQNIYVYDNTIHNNGSHSNAEGSTGPNSAGLEFRGSIPSGSSVSSLRNVHAWNNTIYFNRGYGLLYGALSGTNHFQNNIVTANVLQQVILAATNLGTNTVSFNGCTAAENCGATSKTVLTTSSQPFVNAAARDFRLIAGTNPVRNAGTTVETRPITIGNNDLGAYEQGEILAGSPIVEATFIEFPVASVSAIQPTIGIEGVTIECVTCTGTPVASAVSVKTGADKTVRVSVTGITGTGSCRMSYNGATGNMQDVSVVGPVLEGMGQGVNTVASLDVSGTCDNSIGGAPPATNLHVHHKVNEGAGSTWQDETANNLDTTLTGSPTWVTTGVEGSAVHFANDGVDRRATFAWGNAIDPKATSFTYCVRVIPDVDLLNKVVMGPPSGTNQRLDIGIHQTLGTWGIGVGASSITSTGASEFPRTNNITLLCLLNDATTNTATLAVDAVIGTSAAAVKSTASISSLAGNLIIGCGILQLTHCGGYTVDEPKIWLKLLSQAELDAELASYNPTGTSIPCHKQQAVEWYDVYLRSPNGLVNLWSTDVMTQVIAGGAVVVKIQVDCITIPGSPVSFRLYSSTDGVDFLLAVPDTLGAEGVAMWGPSEDNTLNRFASVCCISGALTPIDGVTMLTSTSTPNITMTTGSSYTIQFIIKFSKTIAGQSRWFKLKQDNGADLGTGYTVLPKVDIVQRRAMLPF